MLKSILTNNFTSQHQTFHYSPCSQTRNNTANWEENLSNYSETKNGITPLHVNLSASSGEPNVSFRKPKEKKKVQFCSTLQQDESAEGKQANKRQQPSSKKKGHGKHHKNTNGDASLDVKEPQYADECNNAKFPTYWNYILTRWAARLDYLAETKKDALKCIRSKSTPESVVYFSDNQPHLSIGSGPDFSSVFLGILDNSIQVAVKKINVKRMPLLLDEARQKSLIAMASNPSLAKVHFVTRDKTQLYIVREVCENSLKHEVRMRRYIPEDVRSPVDYVDLCHRLAKCLAVLHNSGCAHMALKPENIFVSKSGDIKLTDYNTHERNISKKKQYENGAASLCWLPSEALGAGSGVLSQASDIASLGMIFYWLITGGSHPFGDPDGASEACIKNIQQGHYNLKAIEDPYAHHLVQHMIFKEADKRLTIHQVLDHPYFWTTAQKAEYIELLAKAIHFISGIHPNSNTMCNSLMHLLKAKEPNILKSCSDVTSLEDFPKEARANLVNLLNHAHPSSEVTSALIKIYPGILLEICAEFAAEDLENLIEELAYVRSDRKPNHSIKLQPCLSADSGVGSPGIEQTNIQDEFEGYDIMSFPFEPCSKRTRDDSECYASTDDGIDVLSPVCGSLTEEFVFSSPVKISQREFKDEWRTANPKSLFSLNECDGSVDTHFEFDGIDFLSEEVPPKQSVAISIPVSSPCTDMDELD